MARRSANDGAGRRETCWPLRRLRIRHEFKDDDAGAPASTWVRVQQPLAGDGTGISFLPRIGHEVLVDFFDDDIERPYVMMSSYQTSYRELTGEMQNGGAGDGAVPASSSAAPLVRSDASIRQQFKLMGIEHEPAYQDPAAQRAVPYAITKIAGSAKKPA